MSDEKPLRHQVAATFVYNFVQLLAVAIFAILSSKLLGPSGRGRFAGALADVNIAVAVLDLGISQAIGVFATKKPGRSRALLAASTKYGLYAGLGFSMVAMIALSMSHGEFGALEAYALGIPGSMITTYAANLLQGLGKLTWFNIVRVLRPIALIVALLIAHPYGDPRSTLMVLVVCEGLLCGYAWRIAWKSAPQEVGDGNELRDQLRFGILSLPGNLSWMNNQRMDQGIMNFVVPAAVLGQYATAVSYTGILFGVLSAFALAAFRRIGRLGEGVEARLFTVKVGVYLLAVGVPMTLGVAWIAPYAVPMLFGRKFDISVQAVWPLALTSIILSLNYLLSVSLRAMMRPMTPSWAEGTGLVVTIAGLAISLRKFGMMGASWTSLASSLAVLVVLCAAFARMGETP